MGMKQLTEAQREAVIDAVALGGEAARFVAAKVESATDGLEEAGIDMDTRDEITDKIKEHITDDGDAYDADEVEAELEADGTVPNLEGGVK